MFFFLIPSDNTTLTSIRDIFALNAPKNIPTYLLAEAKMRSVKKPCLCISEVESLMILQQSPHQITDVGFLAIIIYAVHLYTKTSSSLFYIYYTTNDFFMSYKYWWMVNNEQSVFLSALLLLLLISRLLSLLFLTTSFLYVPIKVIQINKKACIEDASDYY